MPILEKRYFFKRLTAIRHKIISKKRKRITRIVSVKLNNIKARHKASSNRNFFFFLLRFDYIHIHIDRKVQNLNPQIFQAVEVLSKCKT